MKNKNTIQSPQYFYNLPQNFGGRFFLTLMLSALIFTSCDPDEDGGGNNDFDRIVMLQNYADNHIIPAYTTYQNSVNDLSQKTNNFINTPNSETLQALQTSFLNTYLNWQSCAFYNFGKAAEIQILPNTNSFPTNIVKIEENIEVGDFNFSKISNLDAIGLPALDFLLFSKNETETLVFFENDSAKTYLSEIVNRLKEQIDLVVSDWNGAYYNAFIQATGTDVGSSLGLLVNELNKYYERDFRDGKIGIPLGIRTLNEPQPSRSEAYFNNKVSVEMAKKSILEIKKVFLGDNITNGLGLYENLEAVNATYNGGSLASEIENRFNNVIEKLDNTPSPLSETVLSNNESVAETYTAIQQLLVLLKVDLPSSLGVLITYQDNDGD